MKSFHLQNLDAICAAWGRRRKTALNHWQVVGRDMRKESSAGY